METNKIIFHVKNWDFMSKGNPLSTVSLGLRDLLWPEIFGNLTVGLTIVFKKLSSRASFLGIICLILKKIKI